MIPKAPAPSNALPPVTPTTGRSASAHARARVMLSVMKSPRPSRTIHGAISAESASEPVKMSVGHGRVTTAGDTAVANRSPDRDSQPIAASSTLSTPDGRVFGRAARGASAEGGGAPRSECGREDRDTELMLLLQAVLLHLVELVDGSDLDRRHGDHERALVEVEQAGGEFQLGRLPVVVKSERAGVRRHGGSAGRRRA